MKTRSSEQKFQDDEERALRAESAESADEYCAVTARRNWYSAEWYAGRPSGVSISDLDSVARHRDPYVSCPSPCYDCMALA